LVHVNGITNLIVVTPPAPMVFGENLVIESVPCAPSVPDQSPLLPTFVQVS